MRIIYAFLIICSIFISCTDSTTNFQLTKVDSTLFESARKNAILANEGFIRCENFVHGWLEYADPKSNLIPRNIQGSIDFWNAKDAAADNYPFMVLTSFFVDWDLFNGKMLDILNNEKRLTSRVGSLPDTYSFSKQGFLEGEVKMGQIIFGASEYIKDGLLPLTEWLGESPWSIRMLEMLYDLNKEMDIAQEIDEPGFGNAPREEVNGEMLQTLSRIYWMTGDEQFLDWAIQIGDYYLLGEHHPTRDLDYLRLRDHGCELVSGLCELYVTTNFARPEKKETYQEPLYEMLDRILEVGRNEDGFFYDGINPQTGEVLQERIADNWGYTLNGFYAVSMIDGKEEYMSPIHKLFSNLNKYRNHDWEGNADGYADAIESAINLYNRIPDPDVADWIDSEINVMWGMQQENGIIEGWHGDGNFARTTIMYNLWKSKGVYVQPWRSDLFLGAEQKGDSLLISLETQTPWKGKLFIDRERHKENMHLPIDWPRINQFPEWFTAKNEKEYQVVDINERSNNIFPGSELVQGVEIELDGNKMLIIY